MCEDGSDVVERDLERENSGATTRWGDFCTVFREFLWIAVDRIVDFLVRIFARSGC